MGYEEGIYMLMWYKNPMIVAQTSIFCRYLVLWKILPGIRIGISRGKEGNLI